MSDFELIDEYLSDRLSEEEKRRFRNRLLNDPSFNQEFQERKEIRFHVRENAREDLKTFFNTLETSIEQENTTKDQTVMKRVISIAASLVLIAALTYVGVSNYGSQPSNQELFNEHFTTYTSLTGQVRGITEESLTAKQRAFNAYDAGDYYASEEALSALVAVEPSALNYFYLGTSQLELGKTEEAVKSLNTVINNYSGLNEQAKWYLSLAHLKNENEDAALGSLANIISKESEYEAKAKALLEDMGYSLNMNDLDSGPIVVVKRKPYERDDFNSPDGSIENMDTRGKRSFQWGEVTDITGEKVYRFMTDQPIDGLTEGDMTVFVVIERNKKGKSNRGNGIDGRAFIIDKY